MAGNVILNNNTVVRNRVNATSSFARGGGIFTESSPVVNGCNNILYFNIATNDPEYYGNVTFIYSCVSTGMSGTGNITDDPLFVDHLNDDFHLQSESPCIDTGDPGSPLDPDSTRADMGALYYHQSSGVSDLSNVTQPLSLALFPNYPNPFNPQTTISYQLSACVNVTLKIYNLLGQEIKTLVNGNKPAGGHSAVWDGTDNSGQEVSSGIYFYRISFDNTYSQTQRMLLVR